MAKRPMSAEDEVQAMRRLLANMGITQRDILEAAERYYQLEDRRRDARRRRGSPTRAPTSHKPPQRTPAQRLEHAVQQALFLGNVPKQAKTVLAWKFRMDGEGPWTLRDIVKDNDLDPDVLAGWLPELVEACPKVGDTYLLGGGAAAITTWERVSQRVRDAAPR